MALTTFSTFCDLFLKALRNLLLLEDPLARVSEAASEMRLCFSALFFLWLMFLLNSSKLVIIELLGFPYWFEFLSFDLFFFEWLFSFSLDLSLSLDLVSDDNLNFMILAFLFSDLWDYCYILVRFNDLFSDGVCLNELLSNFCNNSTLDYEVYFFLSIFYDSLVGKYSLVA